MCTLVLTIKFYYPLLLCLKNDGFFSFFVTTLGPNLGCENPLSMKEKNPQTKKINGPFDPPHINFRRGFSIFSRNRDALRTPPSIFLGVFLKCKIQGGIEGGYPHLRF